jgi:hypothetical protein
MNQRSIHTHCQVTHADAQTKAWQRVCLSDPDKIELKKSSLPSENKKYATAQTNTTQTEKRSIPAPGATLVPVTAPGCML